MREVINQSLVDDEATSYDGTSDGEFSTTETENNCSGDEIAAEFLENSGKERKS